MENSFFEYRNDSAAKISSDSEEIIDDSVVAEESFTLMKKPPPSAQKNKTVAESEDSESSDGTESYDEEEMNNASKSVLQRSSDEDSNGISSSDEGSNKQGSMRRQSKNSSSKQGLICSSSSDEEEVSPEIVPRKRPPLKQRALNTSKSSDASPLIRRVKRRMIINDSETDNSIIIDNDRNKLLCQKDTPAKIDNSGDATEKIEPKNMSFNDSNVDESEESDDDEENEEGVDENDDGVDDDDDDFGPDEDEMVMSKATRMSIMGVRPKDDETDDSDYIVSDESNLKSRGSNSISGSMNSLNDLPDTGIITRKSTTETTKPIDQHENDELDDSKLSCSTFGSPVKDNENDITKNITNENDVTREITHENDGNKENDATIDITRDKNFTKHKTNAASVLKVENDSIDLTLDERSGIFEVLKTRDMNRFAANIDDKEDDVVAINDSKPEIIALSSDEDEVPNQNPPKIKTSPKGRKSKSPDPKVKPSSSSQQPVNQGGSMTKYLLPSSYPNQGVVYVKKHVKDNELDKLNRLQEDLHNVRYLLQNIDLKTLPDNGVKLLERLDGLEAAVKIQGERVADMVVEPDSPGRGGRAPQGVGDTGLSWEDIQKASHQVLPFEKQALSTHMAERDMILERLRSLHESLASRPPEQQLAPPPRDVTAALMPHQLHALAWLRWRETQRPCGGILADDMGLGKTITMISLVLSDKENDLGDDDDEQPDDDDEDDPWIGKKNSKLASGGTLVVCPASLIQQWGGEVGKHCRRHALDVCLHHGAARATHPHRLAHHDLVVTTYNLLQRDCEKNGVLMRVRWRRVILDEAHIVRNHKAATSVAVCALRARRRWCLTGTPVQNKDLDVFALLKFLRCTPFDQIQMWKKWIDNKSHGGQERLSTIMRCLLLRRTKQQLQERGQLDCLPDRSLHQITVTLDTEEMNVYHKVLVFSKSLFAQFLRQRAERQEGGGLVPRATGKDDAYAKMHKRMVALQGAKPVKSHEILVLLLRLRQVCCHCGLIAAMLDDADDVGDVTEDPGSVDLLQELNKLSLEDARKDKRKSNNADDDEEEPAGREEGTTVAEAIRTVLSPNNPVFDLKRQSSKIRAVMDCLSSNVLNNKGHKAVVVSQWTSVLHLVEVELNKMRVRSVTLSGKVPVPSRPSLIAELNDPKSDVRVMLLSLCAGGVGLNLCGANHLLLLDPHWNPQLEEQAQDRIYRVGQRAHVHIYRFMALETVEASIRKLQEDKLQLADSVLTGARHTNASKLSIEDLKMLFNMGPQPSAIDHH